MGTLRRDEARPGVDGTRRGRLRIAAVGVVLLVVLAAAAVSVARSTGPIGPVEAVEEYVGLVSAGEAEAASGLVDPAGYDASVTAAGDGSGPDAVPEVLSVEADLLTDEVLASSSGRLTLDTATVDLDRDQASLAAVPVGGIVAVDVEYAVSSDRRSSAVVLRTERLADTWWGATRWRVIDPLVVPVAIETNLLEAGPAMLSGAAIPLSMSVVEGSMRQLVLLYPGLYSVTGVPETYVSAPPLSLVVDHNGAVERDGSDRAVVSGTLSFTPTDTLQAEVASRLESHLKECLAAGAAMDATCPEPLRRLAATSRDPTITRTPTVDLIGTNQDEYREDGTSVGLALGMISTRGTLEATGDDGRTYERDFVVTARIILDSDDVRIEFYSSPF